MAISPRILEITLPTGGRAAILPTSAKDIVTIRGSLLGGPATFGRESAAAAELTADLLDAGAGKLSKDAFRSGLAARGAEVSFDTSGTRLVFSASCFPEDMAYVIARIADALLKPQLPAADFTAEKTRALSTLEEEFSDTGAQAEIALSRMIFPASHPNRIDTTADTKKQTQMATIADAKKIATRYGTGHLALAVVGDVSTDKARAAIEKAFSTSRIGAARPNVVAVTAHTRLDSRRESIRIPDKANTDVRAGGTLGFTVDDPAYVPTALLVHMLGAGFNGHLFQTVRERDSLTYHISARLRGFMDTLDGYLQIKAIFAPQLLVRGTEMLLRETGLFLKDGVTAQTLEEAREEVASSYAVSLGDTQGLAARLIQIMENDWALTRIDEYPDIVRAVTLDEALAAAAHLAALPLSIATAGSI